jgi:hypothetical protein
MFPALSLLLSPGFGGHGEGCPGGKSGNAQKETREGDRRGPDCRASWRACRSGFRVSSEKGAEKQRRLLEANVGGGVSGGDLSPWIATGRRIRSRQVFPAEACRPTFATFIQSAVGREHLLRSDDFPSIQAPGATVDG